MRGGGELVFGGWGGGDWRGESVEGEECGGGRVKRGGGCKRANVGV